MSVELWLVRHGEREWSLDGRRTSWTDIPLTDHGRQRAMELREALAGMKFAAVLVSPRQRARETCEIAGFGDAMQIDEGLQEWSYGESEGKTTNEMRQKYGPNWSVWSDPIHAAPGSPAESVEQVGARADGVIARALEAAQSAASSSTEPKPAEAVALFAHAHILRILASRWIGLPAVDGRLFALDTGSVSVLGHERETQVISRWNRSFEAE